MAFKSFVLIIATLAVVTSISHASSNPGLPQDFCVAVNDSRDAVFVNGKVCKDPKYVTADDFFTSGLNMPGNISNKLGRNATEVNINNLPGLNTLGISLVRLDYAPYGLEPPHNNPRATEILIVLEGTLYVGFVASNSGQNMKNKLFTKILYPGDVFVFPQGLIHFQFNVGKTKAVTFSGFSSSDPGYTVIRNAVFGSYPPINDKVLAKAFQVDKKIVNYLRSQFQCDNN